MVTKTHQKKEEPVEADDDEHCSGDLDDPDGVGHVHGELNEPSQLSVIADSAEVEIYLIDK